MIAKQAVGAANAVQTNMHATLHFVGTYSIRLDLSAAVEVTYMLTINQALVISTEAMA